MGKNTEEYDNELVLASLSEELPKIGEPQNGSRYTLKELIPFKNMFKEINNTITYSTTLLFGEALIDGLGLSCGAEILENMKRENPNANGFDFEFSNDEVSVIAEVKCNIPVNDAAGFGAAQKTGIKNDLGYLDNPKSKTFCKHHDKSEIYKDYYKCMVLLDCNEYTEAAITKICTDWNDPKDGAVHTPVQIVRSFDKATMRKDVIYVLLVKPV